MKYVIYIPQEKLMIICPKISWRGAFILDYIATWQLYSPQKCKKAMFNDEEYIWLNYSSVLENIPLMQTKNKDIITRTVDELKKLKLIKKIKTDDNTVYVRLTDLAVSLYAKDTYPDFEDRPVHKTRTDPSIKVGHNNHINNNHINNNNKLNQNLTEKLNQDRKDLANALKAFDSKEQGKINEEIAYEERRIKKNKR